MLCADEGAMWDYLMEGWRWEAVMMRCRRTDRRLFVSSFVFLLHVDTK